MTSPYQEFVRKAKARFAKHRKEQLLPKGGIEFTAHAHFKMTQYGLSPQKVKSVIHRPVRTEVGIVPKTIAVMQPVSPKVVAGKEMWKQEIWVMFIKKGTGLRMQGSEKLGLSPSPSTLNPIRIISAWRYPGVSPKRSPIPREILQELESGDILGP